MPTKRQRIGRNRTQKTVESLGIDEMLYFIVGWEPHRSGPWESWTEFLTDWQAVRDDWREKQPGNAAVEETFAEWLFNRYGPSGPSPIDKPAETYRLERG